MATNTKSRPKKPWEFSWDDWDENNAGSTQPVSSRRAPAKRGGAAKTSSKERASKIKPVKAEKRAPRKPWEFQWPDEDDASEDLTAGAASEDIEPKADTVATKEKIEKPGNAVAASRETAPAQAALPLEAPDDEKREGFVGNLKNDEGNEDTEADSIIAAEASDAPPVIDHVSERRRKAREALERRLREKEERRARREAERRAAFEASLKAQKELIAREKEELVQQEAAASGEPDETEEERQFRLAAERARDEAVARKMSAAEAAEALFKRSGVQAETSPAAARETVPDYVEYDDELILSRIFEKRGTVVVPTGRDRKPRAVEVVRRIRALPTLPRGPREKLTLPMLRQQAPEGDQTARDITSSIEALSSGNEDQLVDAAAKAVNLIKEVSKDPNASAEIKTLLSELRQALAEAEDRLLKATA